MQAIQEENQVDDEQEDHPERGEIEFDFLQQQKKKELFPSFHPDLIPLKNDSNRSNSTFDDWKLPPLNEITGGRIFNVSFLIE
jgi:hypothetical protein